MMAAPAFVKPLLVPDITPEKVVALVVVHVVVPVRATGPVKVSAPVDAAPNVKLPPPRLRPLVRERGFTSEDLRMPVLSVRRPLARPPFVPVPSTSTPLL